MKMEATTEGGGEGGGGNTLLEIYQNLKKVQLRARDALECSTVVIVLDSAELSFSIKTNYCCNKLLRNRKVEQVTKEAESLKQSLDKYFLRNQKRVMEAKERAELLGRAITHRKALDVLNTVGLSNSVLRLIERRHRVDNWIKYAGLILTLVIVFIIWRWTL